MEEDSTTLHCAKALKMCEPDLAVLLGAERQVYHCHGETLASLSGYIDTLLATPMSEPKSRTISFPDIEPDVWKVAIGFLTAGGSRHLTLTDVNTVLPIYDRYAFQEGLEMCDDFIADQIKSKWFCLTESNIGDLIDAAALAFRLKLPKTARGAVKLGNTVFKNAGWAFVTVNYLRDLAPVIEGDVGLVTYTASVLCGRIPADPVSVVRGASFAETYHTKFGHIRSSIEANVRSFRMVNLRIRNAGVAVVNGNFEQKQDLEEELGVRRLSISMMVTTEWDGHDIAHVEVKALDPYGSTWGIFAAGYDGNDVAQLYSWEDSYSTPFPPKRGLKVVEGSLPLPELDYSTHVSDRW